jgi:hypothetical protein
MRSAKVLIIESRSPEDHFETRREGSILQQVHIKGLLAA